MVTYQTRRFPCLLSYKESEQTVNIAGSDTSLDALGKRASLSIEVADFVYADRFLDPYYDERLSGAAQYNGVGYEPAGMFWQRLRARDPYFAGYNVRMCHGRALNGTITTDRTTHYIATEFDPSKGKATWAAVDVLDLAANDRAYVPVPSQGVLLSAITAAATSFTLSPSGIGSEYAASGFVTVGSEIMGFTRSGDVLTVTRGQWATDAAAHSASDAVQEAYRFTGYAHDAAADLLLNYAGVPSSWVPLSEWQAECGLWYNLWVDVLLPKPVLVVKALGELSILGFSMFTDLAAQKIRFKPNRPLSPEENRAAMTITYADIIGDAEYEGRDSARLTRVEFRSVQKTPTSETSDTNFNRSVFVIDADKEDPRAHGDIRYKLEKTRWLNHGSDTAARIVANKYLWRFATAPERVTVTVKRRKYGSLALASVVWLETRAIPEAFGRIERRLFQIIKRASLNAGEIVLTLQRYEYEGNPAFWGPNDAPNYDAATTIQREDMGFWGANDGSAFPDGRPQYEWA